MSARGGAAPLLSLSWSVSQTSSALASLGVSPEDARILAAQDVDGYALAFLSDAALARMGIPTFGRRIRVLRAAQQAMDEEASRRGMRAPQILGAGDERGTAEQQQHAERIARNDPYGRGASAGYPPAHASASGRFDAAIGYGDDNLLDPAAITPAPSVRGGHAAGSRGGYGRDAEDDYHRTRDHGVSQRVRVPRFGGDNNTSGGALRQRDELDVDRDREAEEAYARDDDEAPDQYDSDVERHFIHPRLESQRAQFDPDGRPLDDSLGGADLRLGHATASQPWLGSIVPPSRPPPFVADPPQRRLALEWVHGYRAFDSRSNLVYNALGDVIYPVAGVCVVYRPSLRSQKHFMGHTDDVRCLAQHPTELNLIASGQSGGIKDGVPISPLICVWDSSSSDLSRSYTLQCTQSDRSIRAVAFSGGSGRYLASVSSDPFHSLKIWDWRKRLLLTAAKSDSSPVFLVKGNPRDENEWVTVGKNHVLFWHFDGHVLRNKRAVFAGGALVAARESNSKTVTLSESDPLSPVSFYAVAFSEKGYACLGAENGSIYVFVNGKVAKTFSGVHRGKILSLEWYRGGFVSGGSDGRVHVLDKKLDVVKSFQFSNKVTSVHIGAGSNEQSDSLLVGTQGADVFEVRDFSDAVIDDGDEKLDAITRGHSDGELYALAMAQDGKHYITAGEDNTLCLWAADSHRLLKRGIISERKGHVLPPNRARRFPGSSTSTHPVNQCARSCAVAPNGGDILVGTNEGELLVFDTRTFARKMAIDLRKYAKESGSAAARRSTSSSIDGRSLPIQSAGHNAREHWVSVISYSPSGHAVAVGTFGSVVVLLDVTAGYAVRSVLDRSSAPITALDWSADGTMIATNDRSLSLLFYHVDEQNLSAVSPVTNATAVRDIVWATRSCPLSWASSGVTATVGAGGVQLHAPHFVNTCDTNSARTLIATGDDSGQVKLYRNPALAGAQPLVYAGHSAQVTCARFSADGRYLVTTGGFDNAVMQWAVI